MPFALKKTVMTEVSENIDFCFGITKNNVSPSTITMHMATKLGRVVAYHEELPPIKWLFDRVVLRDLVKN